MKNMLRITAILAVIATMLAGCGGPSGGSSGQSAGESNVSADPVTLSVFQNGANISDEEFNALIAEPVKKAHPNITLQLVRSADQKLPDLVSSGTFPDLAFVSSRDMFQYLNLNLSLDLNDLVKKNNMDLNQFDPVAIQAIKNYAPGGQLYGIPLFINFSALYYNKDIFDKFGVPYPKDSMTWQDAIELGKKVARTDGGVQYRGLDFDGIRNFSTGLSLPIIDPKTEKASMTTDAWKNVFDLFKEIKTLPNNVPGSASNVFEKDRTLAMMPAYGARLGELEQLYNQGNPLNYDLATYPSFKEAPGLTAEIDVHLLMISSQSKHKDQAFQVISAATGEENQMAATRRGRFSSWKDDKMKQQFGADLKSAKGKNIQGLFKSTSSVGAIRTKYDSDAWPKVSPAFSDYSSGKVDANTALRQADEAINQLISDEKSK